MRGKSRRQTSLCRGVSPVDQDHNEDVSGESLTNVDSEEQLANVGAGRSWRKPKGENKKKKMYRASIFDGELQKVKHAGRGLFHKRTAFLKKSLFVVVHFYEELIRGGGQKERGVGA